MFGVVPRRALSPLVAALALCLLSFAAPASAAPAPAAAPAAAPDADKVTITGSITAGDAQQTGRLTRDGQMHGCEAPTAMPLIENLDPVRRDSHVLQNDRATARCIVVEADLTQCQGNQTMVIAYSAYNPANPGHNVIGATGFSTVAKESFGFQVPANSPYTLVVHSVDAGQDCPLYTLKATSTPLAAVVNQGDAANGFALASTVNTFRNEVGPASDRREISWEEVPEALADPQSLPADYFNTVQPRGLVFTGPADIRISSDGSGATASEFGDHDAGNPAKYQPFSFFRLMSPVDDEVLDFVFRVAGTGTAAPTSAFGVVLVNPGTAGYLLPRDAAGDPLGIYVPPSRASGLGFYGIRFPTPQIYSMSLTGDFVKGVDGTVFDDFVYADPGFRLGLTVSGPGRVSAPGLACPGDCTETFGPGPVSLTAAPTGLTGVRWGGACAGTVGKTCVLTPTESKTAAAATFVSCEPQQAKVNKLKKQLKKRKKAVRQATTRLGAATGSAAVADARGDLIKARKALSKTKKKLRKAKQSLAVCLG
jgi:hypothetical protein